MGRIPVVGPDGPTTGDAGHPRAQPLLDNLEQLKAEGLTGAVVTISFCRCLIQPLQDRAHHPSSIGAVRPNPGRTTQGLQGEDNSPREEHFRRADPQQGLPEGAGVIQPCRPSESSTLVFLRSEAL
jgi:hypothetical protein